MYHTMVRRFTRKNFDEVANGNLDKVIAGCAPDVRHSFTGPHALGGERNDAASFQAWMERVHRLTPNFHFELHDIFVQGWPWNTKVMVNWTKHTELPDGSSYPGWGIHLITLKWFQAVSIEVFVDTAGTVAEMQSMAVHGVAEAIAPQIVS